MPVLDSLLMADKSPSTQIDPDDSKSIYATLTVRISGHSLLRHPTEDRVVPAGLLMGNKLLLICSKATKAIFIRLALRAASLVLSLPVTPVRMCRVGPGMENGSILTLIARGEWRC